VNQNIKRELTQTDAVDLDSQYFIQLSDDAIPALVNALQTSTLPDSVHEKISAALACIRYDREQQKIYDDEYTWQEFHLSRYSADNALASVKDELDQTRIDDSSYPYYAVAPSGEEYPCSEYYFD
jgi:hypothetical protein